MIAFPEESTKEIQKKVIYYSFIVSLCWVVAEYFRITLFDRIIGFNIIEVRYTTSRLLYYIFATLVTILGCALPFILEKKRKLIFSTITFFAVILILRIIFSNYIWNSAIHNSSKNHYLVKLFLLLSNPFYITALIFAFHYKKNILISLISAYLLQNGILSILFYFSWVVFVPYSNSSTLFVALLTWPLFWSFLYYSTNNYLKINSIPLEFKQLISTKRELTLTEYRKTYISTHLLFVVISIATFKLFEVSHSIWSSSWLIMLESIFFILVILIISTISFATLYQRLNYLNLRKYFWYRFIPILNLYLMYITLFKKEVNNYMA